jgi:hypothetical protein
MSVRNPSRFAEARGVVHDLPTSHSRAARASEALGAAIRGARDAHVDPQRVARLAQRLDRALAVVIEPPLPLTTAAKPLIAWLDWLAGISLVVACVMFVAREQARPARVTIQHVAPAPALNVAPARPRTSHPPPTEQPPTAAGVRLESEPTVKEARLPARRHPAAARSKLRLPTPAPAAELVLLQRSQAALEHEPQLALLLAEQHLRLYPRGVFSEEREMLAIEALQKLRRKAEVLERARLFVERFPISPHARRVRTLLDSAIVARTAPAQPSAVETPP